MNRIEDRDGNRLQVGDRVRVVGFDGEPIGPETQAATVVAIDPGFGPQPVPRVFIEWQWVEPAQGANYPAPDYRCPDLLLLTGDQGKGSE